MRAYASAVAGLVVFALLVIVLGTLLAQSVSTSALLRRARDYRWNVQRQIEGTECNVISVSFSAGTLTVIAENVGDYPVNLSDVGLIVDGSFVGRCGSLSCSDDTGNDVVSPGERFTVTTSLSSPPSSLSVLFGPSACRYP